MESGGSLSARISRSTPLRYLFAAAALIAAVALCVGLNALLAGDRLAYLILFPAVAYSAWYCGVAPSILVAILAALGAAYEFQPRLHHFPRLTPADQISILVFLLSCGLIIFIGELRRRQNALLWKAQNELELRVAERTADLDAVNRNLRDLSARLMQLQDEERRRIARELHDSVGQTLAALSMNLSTVRADVEQLARTAAALNDSECLVRDMVTEVRTISHLLHPPLLDELGLSSALRWYVNGFSQRSRIKVDLDMAEDFGRLPAEIETAIFRVVQECLTNIHRHSESPIAKIRVRNHEHEVSVEIEDKGKGIPPKKLHELTAAGTPGVGVRGMQERIRQLGGTLDINSGGHGTRIMVRLPIAETNSKDEIQTEDSAPHAA
jgi:signal transduction histidine kinase